MAIRIRSLAAAACVAAAGLGAASCVEFSGPSLDQNPNAAVNASINTQFTGMQGFQFANLTGDNNRVISVWMRHMAGTGRQWLQYDAPYLNSESLFGNWNTFYTNGGLVDVRGVQEKARAANDQVYLGIAQVWEAFLMGTVADYWGAAPYSEAVGTSLTPKYDTQREIYTRVQAVLDSAITSLGGQGAGPGAFDLVYGGDKQKWLRAARTLKARYYLHVSPVDPAALPLALSNAQQGIASAADDWRTYQSSTEGEQNQWFQFRRQRGTDIGAGRWLVDLLTARNDPRLAQYFAPAGGGTAFRGARPGEEDETVSWLSAARADPGFRQPLITWAEAQLIVAEVQARTAGQEAAARTALNAVRTAAGLAAVPGTLTGQALLRAVLEEKYVALFQNPEVWDIYKRYCYPNFPLDNGATNFPMRLVYGANENSSNRENVPSPEPRRNEVNPRVTTSVDGTACIAQRL
jgi:hypothetical protein